MHPEKQQIRDILYTRFDEYEVRDLCERIGDLQLFQGSGPGLRDRIFELIEHYDRRMALATLWHHMVAQRPDILPRTPTEAIAKLIAEKLEANAQEIRKIDFFGYVPGIRLTTDIEQIEIDLTLTRPVPLKPIVAGLTRLDLGRDGHLKSWKEMLEHSGSTILLGALGSGKTMLLHRIFIDLARDWLRSPQLSGAVTIPVYLQLPYIVTSEAAPANSGLEPLTETIVQFLGLSAWAQVEGFARSMLLLCDGLDGVGEDRLRIIIPMLERFLNRYPGARVIIAMRDDKHALDRFSPEGDYSILSITDISRGDQGDLIRKLFQVTKINQDNAAASLVDIVNTVTSRSLAEVVATPLAVVVSFLVYLSRRVPSLVVETAIRERLLQLTIKEWDEIQYNKSKDANGGDDAAEPLEMMCFFAYDLLDHAEEAKLLQTDLPIENYADRLVKEDVFRSKERAHRVLVPMINRISRRMNIVTSSGGASAQSYRFMRQGDITTLAAMYLCQLPAEAREQVLSKRIGLAKWHATLGSTFDLLFLDAPSEGNKLLDFLVRKVEIDNPQDVLWLLLAASCLQRAEGANLEASDKIRGLSVKVLSDKRQIIDLATRIDLATVLGYVGDPRIGSVVTIPAGEFIMGFDQYPNDRPVRRCSLKPYHIDTFPVTNAQYQEFITAEGYQRKEYWDPTGWNWVVTTGRHYPRYWTDGRFNKPNYPVVGVSWYEADAYARWAGRRLPSEAEWEKAARGEHGNYWPWGNSFLPENLNCSDSSPFIGGTTPIGVYPGGQSPYGVFDLAGNVSEWVRDWYQPYDMMNHTDDSHYGQEFKIRRGGGWGWDQDFARCTCRNASPPTADYAIIGFRCVDDLRG